MAEPDPMQQLTIQVTSVGRTGTPQLSMYKLDGDGAGIGYRLAGPLVNSSGKVLLTKTLDADDAAAIRSFLDEVFPRRDALDRVAQAIMSSSWQPTPGEPPTAAQLATLIETAAETLRQAVSSGPLSGEAAAAVAGKLKASLGHIAAVAVQVPTSLREEQAGRPTMIDVAERADVSLKTVSRVVNGEPHVSLAKTARVLDAIEALGFRPNELARQLRTGQATVSSARPAVAATVGSTVDFPENVKPVAPTSGGATSSPPAGARLQAANPAQSARAR
jgi:hypothetical protein